MIFWTLIALTVIITAFVAVLEARDSWGTPFVSALFALFGCSIASFVIVLICWAVIPSTHVLVHEDTYQLRALGATTGIEGRAYFLGGGYINSQRVLNFITDQNGAIRVDESYASASTIYENATKPTVTVRHYDHDSPWVVPWPGGWDETYEFHVPAGSVVSDYQVGNK